MMMANKVGGSSSLSLSLQAFDTFGFKLMGTADEMRELG